jgi:glycosyltransferase involved in cell wall biosynthesis
LWGDVSWVIPEKNIRILPNSIKNEVSNEEFKVITNKRSKNKSPNLLFLSNMDESKGWFKVLEACKLLQGKNMSFKCNFVGAWPSNREEKKFFEYVSKNNLGDLVNYLGKKIGGEKNKILASSDIFIFPTEYRLETFGLVILEAMMFGLPVIANNLATIPSTVSHNKSGFILKENTPEEIADYCEKLIKNKNLRNKMGMAGRNKFLKYFEMNDYQKRLINLIGNF